MNIVRKLLSGAVAAALLLNLSPVLAVDHDPGLRVVSGSCGTLVENGLFRDPL